ncbi:hypothetical protein Emed_003165 [Eimeria media]
MSTPPLPNRQGQVLQNNKRCRVDALPIKAKKVTSTTQVPKPISTSTPGFMELMMTELPSSQVDWHELINAASALVSGAPTLKAEDDFASLETDLTDFESLGIMFDFQAALAPEDPTTPTPNVTNTAERRPYTSSRD